MAISQLLLATASSNLVARKSKCYFIIKCSLLTSAQRSAEVRALQRALSFYLSIYISISLSGYVCLQFVVYASLILDKLPFSCKQKFQFISIAPDKGTVT